MAQLGSDEVAYNDVSIYFSEEEWKLLQEWQKELYKNLMKEIDQALMSLGPVIATMVFSSRAKEKLELCHEDHQADNRHGDTINTPDVLINISREENLHLSHHQDTERSKTNKDLITDSLTATSVFSLRAEEKEELSLTDNQYSSKSSAMIDHDVLFRMDNQEPQHLNNPPKSQRRATDDCLRAGFPFLNTEVALKKEEQPVIIFIDPLDTEFTENSTDAPQGFDGVSVSVKEEKKTFCKDHSKSKRTESIACLTGKEIFNKSKESEASFHRPRRTSLCPDLPRNINSMIQNFEKESHSRAEMRQECFPDVRGEEAAHSDSSSTNSFHFTSSQGIHRVEESDIYNQHENNLRNSQFSNNFPNMQHAQTAYTYNEGDKSCSLQGEIAKHMGKRERPYACTECDKRFFQKCHLITHNRIHSGEKPYTCIFCHKSFNRKDYLHEHVRIHTGETPYKCTKCEKSFIRKKDLDYHQRKHTQTFKSNSLRNGMNRK